MAVRRSGKPYIWVTHVAKLLGGHQCLFSAWFKAHFRYQKYETQTANLQEWSREHNELMAARRRELEREGYTVSAEEANAFILEGDVAVVAGKPDLIGHKPGSVLVVDGKTGRERESDIWQVLMYLFAIPKVRPQLTGTLEGEVQYQRGDVRIAVTPSELTPERLDLIVSTIHTIAGPTAPPRVPSRYECQMCNIGPADCPQRFQQAREETVAVSEF